MSATFNGDQEYILRIPESLKTKMPLDYNDKFVCRMLSCLTNLYRMSQYFLAFFVIRSTICIAQAHAPKTYAREALSHPCILLVYSLTGRRYSDSGDSPGFEIYNWHCGD